MEDKEEELESLLCDLKEKGKGLSLKEIEKKPEGSPIIYITKWGDLHAGTLDTVGRWKNKEEQSVFLKHVYNYDAGRYLLSTTNYMCVFRYERGMFIQAGKELHEMLEELVPQKKNEYNSKEEKEYFINIMLVFLKGRDVKSQFRIEKLVKCFRQGDQKGPVEMEFLAPEKFLYVQKRIEQDLNETISGYEISGQKDIKEARELIRLAEDYRVHTAHARKVLARKIGSYMGRLKKELKDAAKQKEDLR